MTEQQHSWVKLDNGTWAQGRRALCPCPMASRASEYLNHILRHLPESPAPQRPGAGKVCPWLLFLCGRQSGRQKAGDRKILTLSCGGQARTHLCGGMFPKPRQVDRSPLLPGEEQRRSGELCGGHGPTLPGTSSPLFWLAVRRETKWAVPPAKIDE